MLGAFERAALGPQICKRAHAPSCSIAPEASASETVGRLASAASSQGNEGLLSFQRRSAHAAASAGGVTLKGRTVLVPIQPCLATPRLPAENHGADVKACNGCNATAPRPIFLPTTTGRIVASWQVPRPHEPACSSPGGTDEANSDRTLPGCSIWAALRLVGGILSRPGIRKGVGQPRSGRPALWCRLFHLAGHRCARLAEQPNDRLRSRRPRRLLAANQYPGTTGSVPGQIETPDRLSLGARDPHHRSRRRMLACLPIESAMIAATDSRCPF